ncbi:RICIN domain-containing protein [[Clostridium] polysaccharolyticum]|uniref:Chitodextrinase n=1 Tax=[Clostridium] polysaccharolyticum TaxID=29364 RepID=A0A1I0DD65_9FIRM|nr:RICIN domain-containing protein [[Clostridium] polysaccharolyticum]SET30056.1 Chitodextrinase [[Clostridium] polysaccharolyticum]
MKNRKFAYALISALVLTSVPPVNAGNLSFGNGQIVHAESYPQWSAKKVYNTGDKVVFNGSIWEAQWYTTNEEPGSTGQWGVWQQRGSAQDITPSTAPMESATPSTGINPWDNQIVYHEGDIVSYGGKNWIAGWYSINETPGTTGQWGVWQEYKGTLAPSAAPSIVPSVAPSAAPSIAPSIAPSVAPSSAAPITVSPSPSPIVSGKLADGWYYIKNVNAQKYLQVKNNTGANVQNVEIGTGTGVAGQKWNLVNNSDGTITLTSALGNYMLDIANGADTNGANVQIYSAWGGDAQRFYVTETATKGVYTIGTKASSGTKYLDVANRSTADGANVQQYTLNGGTNQQWVFESVGSAPAVSQSPSIAPSQPAASSAPDTSIPKPSSWPATTYNKMIANSFIQTGNTYRMINAIQKAMRGEDVTIAYIGGSITEGALSTTHTKSYAYTFYNMFKERFGKNGGSNVHYVNAGMSGTPSSLGVIRYSRDVAPSNPDIVFVEFAVNDADDVTNGDAYESLVRNVINTPSKPACMLIFSVFKPDWNLQDRMIPVGKQYNLPMVSIKNAVVPAIKAGQITANQFWASDGWHPMDYGHKLMADSIMYCVDQMLAKGKDANDISVTNNAAIGKTFDGMTMVDSQTRMDGLSINAGGFNGTDTTPGNFQYNNQPKFKYDWKHGTNSGNTSFTMKVTCKSMLFAYKLSNSSNAGKVDIYIDGKYSQTVDSYKSGGWNNPWVIKLMGNSTSAQHTIEIKMANGNANKEFTILGFGVSR